MVAISRLWNDLPASIRQIDISYQQFKWLLKTFFRRWYNGTWYNGTNTGTMRILSTIGKLNSPELEAVVKFFSLNFV